jgi:hypothetical protein
MSNASASPVRAPQPERYEAPAITSREPIRDPVIASGAYTPPACTIAF